jgi:hypothetical protein
VVTLAVALAGCGAATRGATRSGGSGEGGEDTGGAGAPGGRGGAGGQARDGGPGPLDGTVGVPPDGPTPGDTAPLPICPAAGADAGAAPPAGPGPAVPRPFFPRAGGNAATAQAIVDAFTEAQWRNLVPRQSPRDPGSVGSLERCRPAGATGYTWTPQDPDRLTFVAAGGASVGVYPRDGDGRTTVMVTALSGRSIAVTVWNLGGANTACPLQQIIDHEKDAFVRSRLNTLAAAQATPATRSDAFARRIAVTLDEWAKHLPHYYFTGKNGIKPLDAEAALAMGDVQRASDHNGVAHEIRTEPVTAFDAIYDSPALMTLSRELGYDVRERITSDFFLDATNYLTKRVPLSVHVATNLSGTFDELARIAVVLHRPELIDWLNEYLALSVLNLVRDGVMPESMGYGSGYLSENRSIAANTRTYFRIWPATDDRLRAVARAADAYHAAFERGVRAIDSVRMPDGIMAPFGNTPIRRGTARPTTRSVLLPGYGHLTLGDGAGEQQVQVNLGFNDNANHCEQDVLGFTLFGAERELLSDLRYARMPGRPFTESTMAHNTVTVDRREQYRGNNQVTGNKGHLFTAGNLHLFEPNLAGLSVAEVDGARAYSGVVSRYQRMMVLDTSDAQCPYLVDLFRVTGGQTHDYFIHGATLFDMTTPPPDRARPAARSSLPLALIDRPYPLLEGTETFVEPPQDQEPWYGAFRDVFSARSNGNWNATFDVVGDTRGARITMLDGGDAEVFVGKSPSPHRDRMPEETPAAFYGYWRPSLMVRRKAAAGTPLDSSFVTVIEPFRATPCITRVDRLPLATGNPDQVALRLTLAGGREDVVLANLANPDVAGAGPAVTLTTMDRQYALEGRVGVIRRRAGAESAVLVGGARLERAGRSLRQSGATWSGPVSALVSLGGACGEKAFATDAPMPEGGAPLAGRWLKLRLGTYDVVPSGTSYPLGIRQQAGTTQFFRIARVERQGARTLIVLAEDPMLVIENGVARETTRPGRTFVGPTSFEVVLSATE